jgi:hypothetical protein
MKLPTLSDPIARQEYDTSHDGLVAQLAEKGVTPSCPCCRPNEVCVGSCVTGPLGACFCAQCVPG